MHIHTPHTTRWLLIYVTSHADDDDDIGTLCALHSAFEAISWTNFCDFFPAAFGTQPSTSIGVIHSKQQVPLTVNPILLRNADLPKIGKRPN